MSLTDNLTTAIQNIGAALKLKAPIASPTFTGTPAAPTASAGTNTTQLATTAFVNALLTAAVTLTNKRIPPRIGTSATNNAAPTPDADAHDQLNIVGLTVAATFGAPTGTPVDGQRLTIRVSDNGTARALAFNAIYRAVGTNLPTTTVISKTLYIGMIYNAAATKWDVVAVSQEA